MCKYCEADGDKRRIVICFVSEKGMHYGYCGNLQGKLNNFAIKIRTCIERGKYENFRFCPMCGQNISEVK